MKTRDIIAKEHYNYMKSKYGFDIARSYSQSFIYTKTQTKIEVKPWTVDDAIHNLDYEEWCLLNFASYTRPGGGFITGAMAQEEAICHSSSLYNVLEQFQSEYNKNYQKLKNKEVNSLYEDWLIYTPDITFDFKDGGRLYPINVITCPAPNIRNGVPEGYKEALYSRIAHILKIANKHHQENLILGAFGCGVFKNNPVLVAKIFRKLIPLYDFKHIIFAIPPGNDNYKVFKNIFEQ